MSNPVEHEKSGYEYIPRGLMAEEWGKAGHCTNVPEFIQRRHLEERSWMDNDPSRDALEYIWSLDDETVQAARIFGSAEHAEVCRRLGTVNPHWVTTKAASVSYERGLD